MLSKNRITRFDNLVDFVQSDLRKNLSLEEVEGLLLPIKVQPKDFARYVIPDPVHYHRERLVQTDFASLYVLTWLPSQESPIHDHRLSNCGVQVLAGEMSEYFYERISGTEDKARKTGFNRWLPGVVTSSEHGVGIHKVVNESPDAALVTLHLYSPPLLKMTFYTEAQGGATRPSVRVAARSQPADRRTAL